MINILLIKILACVGLFILGVFFGALPWILKARFKNVQKILGVLNALAAGVILGTLMMHMMPHAFGGEHDDHSNTNDAAVHILNNSNSVQSHFVFKRDLNDQIQPFYNTKQQPRGVNRDIYC